MQIYNIADDSCKIEENVANGWWLSDVATIYFADDVSMFASSAGWLNKRRCRGDLLADKHGTVVSVDDWLDETCQ